MIEMVLHYLKEYIWILAILAWIGFMGGSALVAWENRRKGPWHPPFSKSDVIFEEQFASAAPSQTLFPGVARRGITVRVTWTAVIIEMTGPFQWLASGYASKFQTYFLVSNIRRIYPHRFWGLLNGLDVEYLNQDGQIRTVWLRVRKKQEFLWALRRAGAEVVGRCPTCDYDLTGNVSGVCPECGRNCSPEKSSAG